MIRTIGTPSKRPSWSMPISTASRARCSCRLRATATSSCSTAPTARASSPRRSVPSTGRRASTLRASPSPNPAKEPAPDGRLIAPDEGGLTNYRSPSFDLKTGLFIVNAHPSYAIYFAKPADGTFGWAGADYGVWGKAVLEAIDYQTGKIRWTHELGRRLGRRRPHHRIRPYLHRRRVGQRARPRHRRWQDALARRAGRRHGELSPITYRAGRPPVRADQRRRRHVRLGTSPALSNRKNGRPRARCATIFRGA